MTMKAFYYHSPLRDLQKTLELSTQLPSVVDHDDSVGCLIKDDLIDNLRTYLDSYYKGLAKHSIS